MKKHQYLTGLVSTVATFALMVVLAACSAGGTAEEPASEPESDEPEVGMANPWSDVATAEEAGAGAFGDTFEVPETLSIGDIPWQPATFRYMDGIAEADYEGGAVEAWVRKGKDVSCEMLHGVYEDPAQPWHTWTVDVNGTEVSCLGYEQDVANVMEWTDGTYNFSVFVTGLGGENYGVVGDDIAETVSSIH